MTVKYKHIPSGDILEFGGRQLRCERSAEYELVQDNAPVHLEGKVPSALGGNSVEPGVSDPSAFEAATARAEGEPVPGGFPLHKGGGNYELSDGTSVKGKAEAEQAQAELDGQS
jgi:hypothetical protein